MIVFILSMPNVGSWNGKWSGKEKVYAIKKRESSIKDKSIIGQSFHYDFGDGWGASIEVKQMGFKEANEIMKKSSGFLNYGWMVESIIKNGKIEIKESLK